MAGYWWNCECLQLLAKNIQMISKMLAGMGKLGGDCDGARKNIEKGVLCFS